MESESMCVLLETLVATMTYICCQSQYIKEAIGFFAGTDHGWGICGSSDVVGLQCPSTMNQYGHWSGMMMMESNNLWRATDSSPLV